MSQSFLLTCAQQEVLLVEAVSRRHAIELSCRIPDGWATFKSRFLAAEPATHELIIDYPWRESTYALEMAGGESIGVTFRRSHKKCIFETLVVGPCRYSSQSLRAVPALKLAWPNEIRELQRRMYYRAPVPCGLDVPITLSQTEPSVDNPNGPLRYSGQMVDLSAGGVSVALPRKNYPRWQEDTVVDCEFVPDDADAAIKVIGRVRYVEAHGDSAMRIGMQFAGLETDAQRDTLRQLLGLCSRYQQVEMQRLRSL